MMSGRCVAVGSLSAHAVWYGPTPGSRALNIGIGLAEEHRGRGIGAIAQRLLAEELHEAGTVRVEASTDVENVAEQRALAKAGYELEGTLRLCPGSQGRPARPPGMGARPRSARGRESAPSANARR